MNEIQDLHVFLVANTDRDTETLAVIGSASGGALPMIAGDEDRLNKLRENATELADKSGKPLRLVKFRREGIMEVFLPTSFN